MLIWVKSVLQDYLLATVMAMIPLHNQVSVSTQEIHTKNSPRATTMAINTCSHLLKIIRLNSQTLVCLIKQAPRPNISHLNLFQWYKIQVIEKATSQKSKRGATQSVEMVTLQSLLVINNESHRTKRKSWIRAKTCLLTTDSEQLAQLTKKEKALCNQIPLTTVHRPQNIVARPSITTRVINLLECQAKTFKTNYQAHKLSRTWTHGDQEARYQTKRRVIRGKGEPIACSYRYKTIDRCSNLLLITATRWPMVKCSIQALTTLLTLNQTTTNESSRPLLTYWIRQRVLSNTRWTKTWLGKGMINYPLALTCRLIICSWQEGLLRVAHHKASRMLWWHLISVWVSKTCTSSFRMEALELKIQRPI